MAKATPQKKMPSATVQVIEETVNRKGIHAKRGTSKLKTSKNYKKPYRGQGR
jgi:hypothetical protein